MNDDLEEYLGFAIGLAEEAGKIMLRYFISDDIEHEWKADNTPLTIADTKINSLVIQEVKKKFPEHGILGEEASYESERDLIWVVDPIDGTVPFSLGMPISTFSLALVSRIDGQPLVAVVYDPQLEHTYTAIKSKGAFLNGTKLHVSYQKTLERTYISVLGGGPGKERYFYYGKCIDLIQKHGSNIVALISQVYVAAKVATGELIGSVFGYGSPWDSAAVSLIVKEAGGIVTDLDGQERRYDEFAHGCILSANQDVHNKLLEAVKDSKNENYRD